MPGILLYGFGLYDNHAENISGELVEGMQLMRGVHRKVFDVRFDRSMFIDAVDACDPDVIIGLGQSARSRRIRVERKAVNRMGERGDVPGPISREGPDHFFMSLDIPRDNRARVSYDAGIYVCNFSMYVIAQHVRTGGTRVGFIHLPKRHDREEAASFVEQTIHRAVV